MDEVVDKLLRDERFCEVMLPRMQKRYVLEQNQVLEGARVSPLELEGAALTEKEAVPATVEKDYAFERENDDSGGEGSRRQRSRSRSRSRSSSSRSSNSSSESRRSSRSPP